MRPRRPGGSADGFPFLELAPLAGEHQESGRAGSSQKGPRLDTIYPKVLSGPQTMSTTGKRQEVSAAQRGIIIT